jgi:hypothetical protein
MSARFDVKQEIVRIAILRHSQIVMPGLDPGIHLHLCGPKDGLPGQARQ